MAAQRQASSASQTPHLSPAELSYLYTSLGLPGTPIRPDGRSPTQFRPLTAETDILPGTNGSARVGFADGTQAIVGVKAEVEKTALGADALSLAQRMSVEEYAETLQNDGDESSSTGGAIPGFRADDALPVFLAEMMREPLIESVSAGEMAGGLKGRLVINRRWHWRLHLVVLLLSQPLSYPLPLLSLTTHLALLSTKLPKLKSKGEEDPFFDDDWNAAEYLYPRLTAQSHHRSIPGPASPLHKVRPPVTLLVISVAENVVFDPSREEIAVADAVLAVSVAYDSNSDRLKLLSIRTVDPPSRLTQPGVPTSENATTLGAGGAGVAEESVVVNPSTGEEEVPGVWRPRRGGVKRATIARIVKMVLEKGGVGEEVLEGLEGVQVG
ncbi:3' exoribonuclease family protein [Aspergillus ochraceoroseus]|uniref:Ribosomal RNA-processing protein 42 n=1 Tax=Aspergillus ochraceoroseus TaxID=138278 RepID=A0A0F8X822_9EURO|nr:3' exoribonuclease family protein [Aspergillus ochraceoroseus]